MSDSLRVIEGLTSLQRSHRLLTRLQEKLTPITSTSVYHGVQQPKENRMSQQIMYE
jgi:hypothetical protein